MSDLRSPTRTSGRDATAIREIYNLEVTTTTVTFDMVPRTLDEQVAWIDEHSGGHPAIVAVDVDEHGRRIRVDLAVQGPAGVLTDRRGLGLRAPRAPRPRGRHASCSTSSSASPATTASTR